MKTQLCKSRTGHFFSRRQRRSGGSRKLQTTPAKRGSRHPAAIADSIHVVSRNICPVFLGTSKVAAGVVLGAVVVFEHDDVGAEAVGHDSIGDAYQVWCAREERRVGRDRWSLRRRSGWAA